MRGWVLDADQGMVSTEWLSASLVYIKQAGWRKLSNL